MSDHAHGGPETRDLHRSRLLVNALVSSSTSCLRHQEVCSINRNLLRRPLQIKERPVRYLRGGGAGDGIGADRRERERPACEMMDLIERGQFDNALVRTGGQVGVIVLGNIRSGIPHAQCVHTNMRVEQHEDDRAVRLCGTGHRQRAGAIHRCRGAARYSAWDHRRRPIVSIDHRDHTAFRFRRPGRGCGGGASGEREER
jgi:hypothetical protein